MHKRGIFKSGASPTIAKTTPMNKTPDTKMVTVNYMYHCDQFIISYNKTKQNKKQTNKQTNKKQTKTKTNKQNKTKQTKTKQNNNKNKTNTKVERNGTK